MGLCITRRQSQRLFIGQGGKEIIITVERVHEGKVMLNIDAPADVVVDREEVRLRRCQMGRREEVDRLDLLEQELGGEGGSA
jgi:sRNA-binding carbon storage regulator CsrA